MLNIYITDLAAYNAGTLVGEWVSLPLSRTELNQVITEILSEGEKITGEANHEEIFITDYEWSFETKEIRKIDEYEDPYALNKEAFLLSELNPDELNAVWFLLNQSITADLEDAIAKAEDVTIHRNSTMVDISCDLISDIYALDNLPPIISNHIDYIGIANDLEYEGIYWEIDGDVYEYIG